MLNVHYNRLYEEVVWIISNNQNILDTQDISTFDLNQWRMFHYYWLHYTREHAFVHTSIRVWFFFFQFCTVKNIDLKCIYLNSTLLLNYIVSWPLGKWHFKNIVVLWCLIYIHINWVIKTMYISRIALTLPRKKVLTFKVPLELVCENFACSPRVCLGPLQAYIWGMGQ